ncbi:SPX domain-containing protein [Gamsiella multidivaricata]|uniref:SPX domain-containing protein n=1 Tax=Gamsiella multidivaricata TaxID=101098 RepID=UPI0022208550|nr:SPX domain-containing protein [Gamsiella multidivaricata]KAI7830758.1 SPX domain-containing protein [Gamsiella multidivaricata]
MVDTFYRAMATTFNTIEKELQAVTKLKVLKQQIFVAEEWKRRHQEKIAKQEADRGWYQIEWSKVRHGLGNLVNNSSATEQVVIGPVQQSLNENGRRQRQCHNRHSTDATALSLSRENSTNQEQDLQQRGNWEPGDDSQRFSSMDTTAYHNQLVVEDEENRRQHLSHKVARTRIKAALYEFYRSLEMLKNYTILNNTGFVKIMKKYDKVAGWKASKAFIASKLRPIYFMTSTTLDDMMTETEDLFIYKFENGHRRRAMAKLRIPDHKNQGWHLSRRGDTIADPGSRRSL